MSACDTHDANSVDASAGPGKDDDKTWEKRTGGVEGPVLAALRPLSANAVSSRVSFPSLVALSLSFIL